MFFVVEVNCNFLNVLIRWNPKPNLILLSKL